jgi:hypothetical protein
VRNVLNHGYALKQFREQTDLQLTEITARLATIERLLTERKTRRFGGVGRVRR